jgi:hypothetical protein
MPDARALQLQEASAVIGARGQKCGAAIGAGIRRGVAAAQPATVALWRGAVLPATPAAQRILR